jgi:NADH-quinone oxidoreductase subunit M
MTGAYHASTWTVVFAASGVILSAVYALTLYRRVMFGEITNPKLMTITDLNWREVAIFAPLIFGTLWLGLQPGAVFNLTAASVDRLVDAYKLIGG